MAGLKHSRQRDAIAENLRHRKDHPTADMIYKDIRNVYPNISLGTVYRNLSLLVKLGEAKKITTGTGAEHYDGDKHPHNHFICRSCGNVLDMNDFIDCGKIKLLASDQFDGQIEDCSILFYGVCGECLKKEEKEELSSPAASGRKTAIQETEVDLPA